jgi:hypothetical protein
MHDPWHKIFLSTERTAVNSVSGEQNSYRALSKEVKLRASE